MTFTSLTFYGWLALAVALFYLIPSRFRVALLLVLSCLFYLTWSPRYFLLLLGVTAFVFFIGVKLAGVSSEGARRALLIAGLVPPLGSLLFFKTTSVTLHWLMPIGVSYYTFKLLSYVIEVYWDESQVTRSFSDFAAFATFAPQMISGPIQRPYDFFPQTERVRKSAADFERIETGLRLILGGLMMKMLIGDKLADFITTIDQSPSSYTRGIVLLSTLCYMIQLYADFAGYTNIAIGIGKLFGVDSPPNFDRPFAAPNVQVFWRGWHMSLTTWLTDYVFTPLRMATRRKGDAGLVISVMITLTLIGVWHGFKATYLVFGLFQGLFVAVSALTLRKRDQFFTGMPDSVKTFRTIAAIAITYILMTFAQIWFQAPTAAYALNRIQQLAGAVPSGHLTLDDLRSDITVPLYFCIPVAFYLGAGAPGFRRLWAPVDRFVPNWALYGAGALVLSLLTTEAGSKFIYGQF